MSTHECPCLATQKRLPDSATKHSILRPQGRGFTFVAWSFAKDKRADHPLTLTTYSLCSRKSSHGFIPCQILQSNLVVQVKRKCSAMPNKYTS